MKNWVNYWANPSLLHISKVIYERLLLADYKPWHLEPTILHFYSGSLQVLNRRYFSELGQVESRAFWLESAKLQNMVRAILQPELALRQFSELKRKESGILI